MASYDILDKSPVAKNGGDEGNYAELFIESG